MNAAADSGPAAVAGLERAFARIAATRMADLPLNHPRLTVAASAFRPWQGHWLGALVTPWAINLVVLPATDDEDFRLATDRRRTWRFPFGDYDFMGGEEPECGPFHFCSLLSPIPAGEIAGQDDARLWAEAALEQLLGQPAVPAPATTTATATTHAAGGTAGSVSLARRGFLGLGRR